jgi:hypothetical protein
MAAGKYSFVLEQGVTFQREIQYTDSNGTPIDLTNYSARMQMRPSAGSATVYITLSSSLSPDGTGLNMNGLGGTKPKSSGTIGIIVSAYSSSLLNFRDAMYDLELYSASYVTRLIEGKVKLSKEITSYA